MSTEEVENDHELQGLYAGRAILLTMKLIREEGEPRDLSKEQEGCSAIRNALVEAHQAARKAALR